MRIRILTSCTGEKAVRSDRHLTLTDFQEGPEHIVYRERELSELLVPAGKLYSGQQHIRLMRAVEFVRTTAPGVNSPPLEVSVDIVSAGYGIISEDRLIAPYEATFSGMPRPDLVRWSESLGLPAALRHWTSEKADLSLILLGDAYQKAVQLTQSVSFASPTLIFTGTKSASQISSAPHVRAVPISKMDTRRFSAGLVSIKGEVASRLLRQIHADPGILPSLLDPAVDVLDTLAPTTAQLALL